MPWSKSPSSWPEEFFTILQAVGDEEKAFSFTFPTPQKARYERLRWYGFFSALRHKNHMLAPYVSKVKIYLPPDSPMSLMLIPVSQYHKMAGVQNLDSVYKKAVKALEVIPTKE